MPRVRKIKASLLFALFFFCFSNAFAHEIRPAFLQIQQQSDTDYEILWKIPMLNGRIPKISPKFPSGFIIETEKIEQQLDATIIRSKATYSSKLNGQTISIDGLAYTLIDVLVQIDLQDGFGYTFMLQADQPSAIIPTAPKRWAVAGLYLKLGIEHILLGVDHLLFVLGLLLLVQNFKSLVHTITAFTLAHSVTLILSALNLVKVPSAPVEAVIALSIVFLAKEYIDFKNGKESITAKSPWIIALSFGLLHGFGFAGALAEIGLPQKEVPIALFMFNLGVEVGQLIFIGLLYFLYQIMKKIPMPLPEWSWKVIPYTIGGIASFWLIERTIQMIY